MIAGTNVTVNVKDMDLSVSFYASLGFKIKNRWGNYYAQLDAPGITVGLHPSSNLPGNSGNVSIGFIATDFEKAKTRLQELSIKAELSEEEGGEFLQFNDPDGTALYFIKPRQY